MQAGSEHVQQFYLALNFCWPICFPKHFFRRLQVSDAPLSPHSGGSQYCRVCVYLHFVPVCGRLPVLLVVCSGETFSHIVITSATLSENQTLPPRLL
jgi:hypothetical protein